MRLAAVVQSSHDAVAAKTLNGIITDWNQSAERIFGYKPKEIIGKSVLTLIPKDRQDEEQEILRRIRHGELLDHYETVRRRKDGQLIDVSLTISPIKDPKGEIVGVSKIARDITSQKQTERRLTEQARLLNLTNDSIIVRDHQDRIWSAIVVGRVNWFIPERTAKLLPSFRGGRWTEMCADDQRQFSKPTLMSPRANAQSNNSGHSINLLNCRRLNTNATKKHCANRKRACAQPWSKRRRAWHAATRMVELSLPIERSVRCSVIQNRS
jgi:PAS domain S-box-containing protein